MEFAEAVEILGQKVTIRGPSSFFYIKNNSDQLFTNCSFTLFNTHKYKFIPNLFNLDPNSPIKIQVQTKVSTRTLQNNNKDFAYLQCGAYKKKIMLEIVTEMSLNEQLNTFDIEMRSTQKIGKISQNKNRTCQDKNRVPESQNMEEILQINSRKSIGNNSHTKKSTLLESKEEKLIRLHLHETKQLKKQILALSQQNHSLHKRNIHLTNTYNEMIIEKQQIDQMRNKTQEISVNQAMAVTEEIIKKQSEQIEFLMIENRELKELFYTRECEEMQNREHYATVLESKEKEISNISNIYNKKRQLSEKLQKQKKEAEEQLCAFKQKWKQMQRQLEESKKKLKKQEQLQQKIRELQNKNTQLKVLGENLAALNKAFEQNNKDLHQQNSALSKKATSLEVTAQQQKKHSKEQDELFKQNLALLNEQKDNLKKHNEEMQKMNSRLQKENDELKEKNDRLGDNLERVKGENERLKDDKNWSQKKMLENYNNLDKINQQLKNQLDQAKNKINYLQPQLQTKNNSLNHQKQKNKELEQQLACDKENKQKQTLQLFEKDKNIDELKNQLKSKDNEIFNLCKIYPNNFDTKSEHQNEGKRKKKGPKSQNNDENKQATEEFFDDKVDLNDLLQQLQDARQFKQNVNQKMNDLGQKLGLPKHPLGQDNPPNNQKRGRNRDSLSVVNFFNNLDKQISDNYCDKHKLDRAEKELQYLKGRLKELEALRDQFLKKEEQKKLNAEDRSILEFMREQMKKQHRDQHEALKMSEEKFQILKKKIYEEYRTKIVQTINKKDQNKITQIEQILQRFVQGLSNTSHKEAIMAKEIKLKQEARRQIQVLRQKISELEKQNSAKKQNHKNVQKQNEGNEINEKIEREAEYLDLIKNQAKAISGITEINRLKQQLQLIKESDRKCKEQVRLMEEDICAKEDEIVILKKKVYEVSKECEEELEKRQIQIQELKKKYVKLSQTEVEKGQIKGLNKEISNLTLQIKNKTDMIMKLQKRVKQLLSEQNSRQNKEQAWKNKEQSITKQLNRKESALKQLRTSITKTKQQNQHLKTELSALEKDKKKKISTLKSQNQEIEQLKTSLTFKNEEISKMKQISSKEKQLKEKNGELKMMMQALEGVIRSLLTIIKSVYSRVEMIRMKRSRRNEGEGQKSPRQKLQKFESLMTTKKLVQINCLAIDESISAVLDELA